MLVLGMSDWSGFSAIDDDDDLLNVKIDTREYAVEEDSQEVKAQVGASLDPPDIDDPPTDPIFVPAGSQLEMSEETVLGVLQGAREELGTLFGYSAENRGKLEGWIDSFVLSALSSRLIVVTFFCQASALPVALILWKWMGRPL